MFIRAGLEHGVDFSRSLLVGDKESDIEAGIRTGVSRRFLIGQPIANLEVSSRTNQFESLEQLARHLLAQRLT